MVITGGHSEIVLFELIIYRLITSRMEDKCVNGQCKATRETKGTQCICLKKATVSLQKNSQYINDHFYQP
jgi:hypothetical protein